MAKKIQYSPEMKKVIDELGLKDENIMYVNIIREPLERILRGEKTVEFRDLSDFWLKKVANFNSKGEYVSDKPITHILFQNGMDKPPHAKRALVEMKYNIDKEEKIENPDSPKTQYILKEAEKEGFAPDDTYLAIALGKVIFRENI